MNNESCCTLKNHYLYMAKFDVHSTQKFKSEMIRPTLFMYSLFADELCVSDSIINNNPELRKLIYPELYKEKIDKKVNADFIKLLGEGFLKPIVRKGFNGFVNLRKEKEKTNAQDLPEIGYCEYLDNQNLDYRYFDLNIVSQAFNNNLKRKFENQLTMLNISKNYKSIIEELLYYVNSCEQVLYATLLQMLGMKINNNMLSDYEYKKIVNLISLAYAFNVPKTLDMNICIESGRTPIQIGESISRNTGFKEKEINFSLAFSLQNLQSISVDGLKEIKQTKEFRKISDALNTSIKTETDAEQFFLDFEGYLDVLEGIYKEELTDVQINKTFNEAVNKKIKIIWMLNEDCNFINIQAVNNERTEELLHIFRPIWFNGDNEEAMEGIARHTINWDFVISGKDI